MRDPYTVLGVQSVKKGLKSAYRKLAKAHHRPNQDDPGSPCSSKFPRLYSCPTRTSVRHDRGEIDADGNPRFAGSGGARPGAAGRVRAFSAEDIPKEFMSGFGGQPRGGAGPRRQRRVGSVHRLDGGAGAACPGCCRT